MTGAGGCGCAAVAAVAVAAAMVVMVAVATLFLLLDYIRYLPRGLRAVVAVKVKRVVPPNPHLSLPRSLFLSPLLTE